MDYYINKQAAIDALEGEIAVTGRVNAEAVRGYANLVCDRMKRLPPADVIEVVRCKDCRYAVCIENQLVCVHPKAMRRIDEDSYCCYGEG